MALEMIQNGCVDTEAGLGMDVQAVFLSHRSVGLSSGAGGPCGQVHVSAHDCNLSRQPAGIPLFKGYRPPHFH